MTAATGTLRADIARRQRELVTPEGLALPVTIAGRGARAGALLLDLVLIVTVFVVLGLILTALGLGMLDAGSTEGNPALELILVVLLLVVFLSRYGYFLWFELGPRGATPGKRAMGIRVAARPTAAGRAGR